jgi:RNA polymerase sigma factor (sigma-70 family)
MPKKVRAEEHIGLVYYVATILRRTSPVCRRAWGSDLDSYVGPGMIGLLKAIKSGWNPGQSKRYAFLAIMQEMLDQAQLDVYPIVVPGEASQGNIAATPRGQHARSVLALTYTTLSSISDPSFEQYREPRPDKLAANRDQAEAMIRSLPTEQYRKYLRLYFGLDGRELSMRQIARRFKVTPEAVRQIVQKALVILRRRVKAA